MSRAIISIHVGQCGVQLGNSVWELLCMEHEINKGGIEITNDVSDYTKRAMDSFFTTSSTGRHVPRAIFVDLDPTTIDEVRTGAFRTLYHPDQLISGMEDAASNFARGYYTVGRTILEKFLFSLRQNVESADSIQGFLISHSPSGGTGGGLGSLIQECISVAYPKLTKINVSVLPASRICAGVVDPYNTTVSSHFIMEHTDVSFLVDNEAMYTVCQNNLLLPNASYHHVNRILAQLWSAITASFRYGGVLNTDIGGLLTNLVPFPRLQFPLCSYAPIAGRDIADHQHFNVINLAREVFRPDSRFLKLDTKNGKYMSCVMMFRGDISCTEVGDAIQRVKSTELEFVDWCPTGFKVTVCNMPTAVLPQSLMAQTKSNVTMIANTSAISEVWESLAVKTKRLYQKRAFVHWFVSEGMEEGELSDSLDNITSLVKDYRECAITKEYGHTEFHTASNVSPANDSKMSSAASDPTKSGGSKVSSVGLTPGDSDIPRI